MFQNLLKKLAIAGSLGAIASSSAIATTAADVTADVGTFQPITLGDSISLDPCGTILTIAANGGSQSSLGSICNITSGAVGNVGFYYLISSGSTTHSLVYGSDFDGLSSTINSSIVNPSGGTTTTVTNDPTLLINSPATFSTGAGTLFSTAGTYVISLVAAINQSGSFTVGGSSYTGQIDTGLTASGTGIDVNGASVGNFDGIDIGTLGFVNSSNPADGNGLRNVSISQTTLVVNAPVSVPEPSSLAVLLGGLLFGWRTHRRKMSV